MDILFEKFEAIVRRRSHDMNDLMNEFRIQHFPAPSNFDDFLNGFALRMADRFQKGELSFDAVDDALWAVMTWLDYKAPTIFWKIAVFFEDFETEKDPDKKARVAIGPFLKGLAPPGN